MTTKIKNRTSIVSPRVTAERIEQLLAESGALSVSRMYNNGEIVGFEFLIATSHGNINFRMPVDTERAYSVMLTDAENKLKTGWKLTDVGKKSLKDQSARTAWKIAQEWIEIQLSMVRMQQAELVQVFMPYAVKNGVTLFDAMKRGGFTNLLSEPKGEITIE